MKGSAQVQALPRNACAWTAELDMALRVELHAMTAAVKYACHRENFDAFGQITQQSTDLSGLRSNVQLSVSDASSRKFRERAASDPRTARRSSALQVYANFVLRQCSWPASCRRRANSIVGGCQVRGQSSHARKVRKLLHSPRVVAQLKCSSVCCTQHASYTRLFCICRSMQNAPHSRTTRF